MRPSFAREGAAFPLLVCAHRRPSAAGRPAPALQTTSAHLSAALASQVDATCSGLEALEAGHQSLRRLQQTFVQIKSLCGDCESLVDAPKFAKIRRLSATHFNLAKTLCDVEAVAALPQEAGEAEELLRDGGGGGGALVAAYVRLAMLEGTSAKARRALEGAGAGARDTHNLGTYFTQVQRSMGQLEERLWSRVRNYRALARADPAALVAALQVVEMQEALDAELLPAGQGE
jgi:exocyst complex component 3